MSEIEKLNERLDKLEARLTAAEDALVLAGLAVYDEADDA